MKTNIKLINYEHLDSDNIDTMSIEELSGKSFATIEDPTIISIGSEFKKTDHSSGYSHYLRFTAKSSLDNKSSLQECINNVVLALVTTPTKVSLLGADAGLEMTECDSYNNDNMAVTFKSTVTESKFIKEDW